MTVVAGLIALALTFVALLVLTTMLVIAAPWEGGRAPLRDHLRIGRAVVVVDLWLELRGVSGRRRRELRSELRGNLYEAARADGSKQAVAALGSLRELAAGYAGPLSAATPWSRGVTWFSAAALVIVGLSLITTVTWLQASSAGSAPLTAGRPVFSPWLQVAVEHPATELAVSASVDWWVILIPAIAFVIGAGVRRPSRRGELIV